MRSFAITVLAVGLAITPAFHAASAQPAMPGISVGEVFADHPGPQRLADAACTGDAALVRQALAEGVPVNQAGRFGVTPLIWALTCRGIVFNDMRANGAIRSGRPLGATPVDPGYLAAIAALLEGGADPNLMIDGKFGPIYPGGRAPWLDGNSAVLIAAEFHEADVLALLLAHGGNPAAVANGKDKWALLLAYDRGEWLDLGPQMTPDRAWPWANVHLLLQAGARLEQASGSLYNIVEIASMKRPALVLEWLKAYSYQGGYEHIAYYALYRIEQGYPAPDDSRALLAFLEGSKGVDLDAVRRKYRMAPYDKE